MKFLLNLLINNHVKAMTPASEALREKNPYRRGADDGFIMGALLVIMFMTLIFANRSSVAALLSMIIIIVVVPAATYIFLQRSFMKDNGLTLFSSLWVQGIVMFLCGTLIMAMFEYIYLRFINPSYIINLFHQAQAAYASLHTPAGDKLALVIENAIKNNMLPTPITLAIQTLWLGVFSGSVLSACMSGLVRWRCKGRY